MPYRCRFREHSVEPGWLAPGEAVFVYIETRHFIPRRDTKSRHVGAEKEIEHRGHLRSSTRAGCAGNGPVNDSPSLSSVKPVSVSGEFTIENLDAKHGVVRFRDSMF